MATLNLNKTVFDPANEAHRKICFELASGSYRGGLLSGFHLKPQYISVVDMIKTEVANYYLSMEFHQ